MLSMTDNRSLGERIINAVSYSLIPLKSDDLPIDIQEKFRVFMSNITSVAAKEEEGTITATV